MPRLGLKNVAYNVGLFNETLPTFLASMAHKETAFIHVDGDLYASAKDVLCSFVQRDAIVNRRLAVPRDPFHILYSFSKRFSAMFSRNIKNIREYRPYLEPYSCHIREYRP